MPKTKSKKGTKQWRQNSKVDDIELALHEIQKEELKGGPASKKENTQLFFLDKGGVQTKKTNQEKKLRIDQILQPNKYAKSFEAMKKSSKINQTEEESLSKIVKHLKTTGDQKKKKRESKNKRYDIWDSEEPKDKSDQQFDNGFDNPMAIKTIKGPKHNEPKHLPAVKIEAPGNSYNPDSVSHHELLAAAANDVLRKEKIEKKLDQQIGSINRISHNAKVKHFLKSVLNEAKTGEEIDNASEEENDSEKQTQLLLENGIAKGNKNNNSQKLVQEKQQKAQKTKQIQNKKVEEEKEEEEENQEMDDEEIEEDVEGEGNEIDEDYEEGEEEDDVDEENEDIENEENINENNQISSHQVTKIQKMNIGEDGVIVKPIVSSENRKTTVQRNKEKRKLLQLRQEIKKKKKERREKQFQKLDKVVDKIDKEKLKQREKRIKKKKSREAKKVLPKRLGKVLFETPEVDFKFKNQITGSLRTLIPEGNLFKSRQLSFQERNIIEPRLPTKRKQGQYKIVDTRRERI